MVKSYKSKEEPPKEITISTYWNGGGNISYWREGLPSVNLANNKRGRYAANVEKLSVDNENSELALDGFTIYDNYEHALEEGLFETLNLMSDNGI